MATQEQLEALAAAADRIIPGDTITIGGCAFKGPQVADALKRAAREPTVTATRLVCIEQGCEEPTERCLKHLALHLLRTKGKAWLMEQAMKWMAESQRQK